MARRTHYLSLIKSTILPEIVVRLDSVILWFFVLWLSFIGSYEKEKVFGVIHYVIAGISDPAIDYM
jgi:hypothetical protein